MRRIFYSTSAILGANPNQVDAKGNSLLSLAVRTNSELIVNLLVQFGADIHHADASGENSLHLSILNENRSIIELLIQFGANPFEVNQRLESAIDLAMKCDLQIPFLEKCREIDCSSPSFTHLSVSGLSLYYLSPFFSSLSYLLFLDLSHNRLTSLPLLICNLVYLEFLDVSFNLLDSLPFYLSSLSHLTSLNVEGNPLHSFPPSDLVPRTGDKVLQFLRNPSSQEIIWNRQRVLFLGETPSGKTALISKILGSKVTKSDRIMDIENFGIEVSVWNPNIEKGDALLSENTFPSYYFWDFDEGHFRHRTFQLFLTPSSVFVIVFRADDPSYMQNLEYWMHSIRSNIDLHVYRSSVLLVGTYVENCTVQDIENIERKLRNRFHITKGSSLALTFVSLHATNMCHVVKNAIIQISSKLPKLTVCGFQLILYQKLHSLSANKKKYIFWDEFIQLATDCGLPLDSMEETAILFHNLGVIFYFHDILKFHHNRAIFLDVSCITNMSSSLFNAPSEYFTKETRISCTQICQLWKQFTSVIQEQFLIVLDAYEVLYRQAQTKATHCLLSIPSNGNEISNASQMAFVPSLLPVDSITTLDFWKRTGIEGPSLSRLFRFVYLPDSFFFQLLAICLLKYQKCTIWRNGVYFRTHELHSYECQQVFRFLQVFNFS
jgi:Leucine-rich repeat (LRR) protein